jgi:hypothetical protein
MLKALEISSDSAGNVVLGQAIRRSAENISSGETLSSPLSKCGLFPGNIMAMITIAEEANNLEKVLGSIADGIDKKVARQLDTMVRLIEPALLMVMGGAVLFVIVALLLPPRIYAGGTADRHGDPGSAGIHGRPKSPRQQAEGRHQRCQDADRNAAVSSRTLCRRHE